MSEYKLTNEIPDPDMGSAFYFRMREPLVYPHGLTPMPVEGKENLAALDAALAGDRELALFYEMPPMDAFGSIPFKITISSFQDNGVTRSAVGVRARIVKHMCFPDGTRKVVLRGISRISALALQASGGDKEPIRMKYRKVTEECGTQEEDEARQKSLTLAFQELAGMLPGLPEELNVALTNAPSPSRTADLLSDAMNFSYPEKLLLLAIPSTHTRLEILAVLLNRELETMKLGMKIQSEVQESVGKSQREFYLREQLRTIREELGEETRNPDLVALHERFDKADLPENVSTAIKQELSRLELIPTSAPEYHISYNYINWLLNLPWKIQTEDQLDCIEATKILDEDHYGLADVKDRILEFLAVLQLRKDDAERRAPILCLVGPPGVGKTSLGRSIARAMNRKFIRVSLGGVRDEAEIRGHRRTYVGAMPGRIVQNLKRVGSSNPVFMLDEVDKLAHDFRGDPASALLEVLDPEQNFAFNDNYIELPLDLSRVFFIATANVLDEIPGPLRDRMEVIQLSGYTAFEKREIAKRYIVPREIKENGLSEKQFKFQLSSLDEIISGYTREAGVRSLERVVAQVCRRLGRKKLSGEFPENKTVKVTAKLVRELLGARKFLNDEAEKNPRPGCATGMAWTSVGGVILPVETLALPGGKGNLKLTGSLGKVMQESAETAFALVRSLAPHWGIDPEYFNTNDFHIHVPDGATPKDGPSAGITLTLALISLLRRKPLMPRLAMTGEITLQGRVTAIGGVREKLVGALRAGIKTIIMPEENRKDFDELPPEIRDPLDVHFVSDYAAALAVAFQEKNK